MRTRAIVYWVSTVLIAFSMGSGGIGQLAHVPGVVDGFVHLLGYPAYFVTILGFWKLLGAIAILVPRFPRLKEWAYAGIFFNVTGAALSHAAVGDYGPFAFHIVINLVFAGLVLIYTRFPLVSIAIQTPNSRTPGRWPTVSGPGTPKSTSGSRITSGGFPS